VVEPEGARGTGVGARAGRVDRVAFGPRALLESPVRAREGRCTACSARRTQSGRVVQNGRTAAADGNAAWGDGQSQAGYWAPPARGARLPSYNQVAGAAAAGGYAQPLEIQAGPHSLSSAPRVPAPAVDIQAKRKIRRARRQERNAAMRYEELLIRLEQLILDHGGAEYVTTDSIVQLYQVRHTTRASRPSRSACAPHAAACNTAPRFFVPPAHISQRDELRKILKVNNVSYHRHGDRRMNQMKSKTEMAEQLFNIVAQGHFPSLLK
jgi:hypothetical protein